MKTLPINDRELTEVIFKGARMDEPRGLTEKFGIEELCWMLDNGNFAEYNRTWMYYALDVLMQDVTK